MKKDKEILIHPDCPPDVLYGLPADHPVVEEARKYTKEQKELEKKYKETSSKDDWRGPFASDPRSFDEQLKDAVKFMKMLRGEI